MLESTRNPRAETPNTARTAPGKSIQKRRNNTGTNSPRSKYKKNTREIQIQYTSRAQPLIESLNPPF
jgi:hypothetical protein